MMLISRSNENDQLRPGVLLLVLKPEMDLSVNNRIMRLAIAFPLGIILVCSHLLLGNNYYVYVFLVLYLAGTACLGWCFISWGLKSIKLMNVSKEK